MKLVEYDKCVVSTVDTDGIIIYTAEHASMHFHLFMGLN